MQLYKNFFKLVKANKAAVIISSIIMFVYAASMIFSAPHIIDKNEEFCLVEAGTRYGISQFDYIVRNGSDVKESDITA